MFWFYGINMIILFIFEFKEVIKTEAFDNIQNILILYLFTGFVLKDVYSFIIEDSHALNSTAYKKNEWNVLNFNFEAYSWYLKWNDLCSSFVKRILIVYHLNFVSHQMIDNI